MLGVRAGWRPSQGPARRRRCPARTPRAVGRAHPLVEPGSRAPASRIGCPSGGGWMVGDCNDRRSPASGGFSEWCGWRVTAAAASRRALAGSAPIFGRRRLPSGGRLGARPKAGSQERSFGRGRWGCWGCALVGARHRDQHRRRRCPARTPQAVGRAHPLVEKLECLKQASSLCIH